MLLNKQGHTFKIKCFHQGILNWQPNWLYTVTHRVYNIQDTGFLKSQWSISALKFLCLPWKQLKNTGFRYYRLMLLSILTHYIVTCKMVSNIIPYILFAAIRWKLYFPESNSPKIYSWAFLRGCPELRIL